MNTTIQKYQMLCGLTRFIFQQQEIIISAGCIRDTLNNAPVKDVDTFVYMPEVYDIEGMESPYAKGCKKLAKYIGADVKFRDAHPDYLNIFDICDITSAEYGIIQLIGINRNPAEDVKNYDFGISQVFVTPDSLFMTIACHEDMMNRTITFTPSDKTEKAMIRSQKRYLRLREKYPDWKFVNCEVLEDMGNGSIQTY